MDDTRSRQRSRSFNKHPLVRKRACSTTTRPTYTRPYIRPKISANGRPGVHPIHLSEPQRLLPPSLKPLDINLEGFSLPNVRKLLVSYINDIDARLSTLEPVHSDVILEAASFVKDSFEYLEGLSRELGSHLPELDLDGLLDHSSKSVPGAVTSKLSELDFSTLKTLDFDFGVFHSLDDVYNRFSHLDLSIHTLSVTESYVPALKIKLGAVKERLCNLTLPSASDIPIPSLGSHKTLADILPDLYDNDNSPMVSISKSVDELTHEITTALEASLHGAQLITYEILPDRWRNNEFIQSGYRFIPIASWPMLLLSAFRMHNETMNIQTHFIPFFMIILFALPWSGYTYLYSILQHPWTSWITYVESHPELDAIPRYAFAAAAAGMLGCSVIWHISAGCSDFHVVKTGARIDYVGIGWMISISVTTVVYYGFSCHPHLLAAYLGLSAFTGSMGSIVPFQAWFDERKYRHYRIMFFVALAVSSFLPLTHLVYIKGFFQAIAFASSALQSIVSYSVGLIFYASHFPECFFPGKFDFGGSHAIWHLFIVNAVRIHWNGMGVMQQFATQDRQFCLI